MYRVSSACDLRLARRPNFLAKGRGGYLLMPEEAETLGASPAAGDGRIRARVPDNSLPLQACSLILRCPFPDLTDLIPCSGA